MKSQLGLRFIGICFILGVLVTWFIFYKNPQLKELGNGEAAYKEKVWEGGKVKRTRK
jgi:hypothetical protein